MAGYVRSYARYLSMDPDPTFARFCIEANFEVAHGMSEAASGQMIRKAARKSGAAGKARSFRPFQLRAAGRKPVCQGRTGRPSALSRY